MKEKYVQAAIDRIDDWCKATHCKIPTIAYMQIRTELNTMFECPPDTNRKGNKIHNDGKN